MTNDLINGAADAASFTGLTRRQIYRLTEQGLLPVIRKGRRLFYRRSELEATFTATDTSIRAEAA